VLLVLALAGCGMAAESADRANRAPGWDHGGQTGSLLPRCGVAEAAIGHGIPESAEGLVIYTSECEGSLDLAELSVRGPDGEPVDFEVEPLGEGAVLITFMQPPVPGSYRIGGMSPSEPALESDAGAFEDDAGNSFDDEALARPAEGSQDVSVLPAAPAPMALGQLSQLAGACDATLRLSLDPSMAPHVGALRLEVHVDGRATEVEVPYGTLEITNEAVLVELPRSFTDGLPAGAHVVKLQGEVAGLEQRFESSELTIHEPCEAFADPSGGSSGASTCSTSRASASASSWLANLCVVAGAAVRLRKRRRRRRLREPDRTS
jgi:hypothetical protein